MKSKQVQFAYKKSDKLFYMQYEIITDETERDKVMQYIREKIYKREPEQEILSKTKYGWKYEVYER